MIELYARSATALAERFHDTTVVLDHGSGCSVELNAAAACVWDALDEPADVERVAAQLEQRFGIATDRAAGDARSALESLVQRGLVTRTATGPAR